MGVGAREAANGERVIPIRCRYWGLGAVRVSAQGESGGGALEMEGVSWPQRGRTVLAVVAFGEWPGGCRVDGRAYNGGV